MTGHVVALQAFSLFRDWLASAPMGPVHVVVEQSGIERWENILTAGLSAGFSGFVAYFVARMAINSNNELQRSQRQAEWQRVVFDKQLMHAEEAINAVERILLLNAQLTDRALHQRESPTRAEIEARFSEFRVLLWFAKRRLPEIEELVRSLFAQCTRLDAYCRRASQFGTSFMVNPGDKELANFHTELVARLNDLSGEITKAVEHWEENPPHAP